MNILASTTPQFGVNYDTGWIGFLAHNSFVARGIEWFTRRWTGHGAVPAVSHVFVVTGDGQCIEANGDGVDVGSLTEYFDTSGCTVYLRAPKGWTEDLGGRIAAEALKFKGLQYDYDLLVADAVSYSLFGQLVNELTRDSLEGVLTGLADSQGRMICDQLAIVAMQAQPELRPLGTLKTPARENNPQRLFADDELFAADVTKIIGGAKVVSGTTAKGD